MIAEGCAIALALALGIPIAALLDRDARPSALAGEGLLIGLGFSCATLCVIPWSRGWIVGSMLGVAALATGAVWRRRPRRRLLDPIQADDHARGAAGTLIVLFAIIALLGLAGYALYATLAPPPEFDYVADWGLKARAFFEVRAVDWSLLERAVPRDTHPDYPLLLPLLYDFIAILRGTWNDAYLGAVHVAFAAALLLVILGSAVDDTRSRVSATFLTAAMVPLTATPWIGMAEGPFIAYATAALLLIRRGSLTGGAVLLGLAACTKNEGLTLILAVVLALFFARRRRDGLQLWPAVAIALPWLLVRMLHRLPNDLAEGSVFSRVVEHLKHPDALIDAVASASLGKPLFWIALAAGIVIASRALAAKERFLFAALFVQFGCYLAAYLASPYNLTWHVTYSWERLVAHLMPALTYAVLVALLVPQTGRTSVSLETSIVSN